MSSWEKECNPFEPVKPNGNKTQAFKPVVSIGPSWQTKVVPGGDNFYKVVGKEQPCWDKSWRPLDSNHLERIACVDLGNFDITVLLDREENVSKFRDGVLLESALASKDGAKVKEALVKFLSEKAPKDSAILGTKITLVTLQKFWMESTLRNLDSVLLSLYTKAEDDKLIYQDSFWVFGTKSPKDAVKLIASLKLKAEQQIELLSEVCCTSRPVVFKLDLALSETSKFRDIAKLTSSKYFKSSCKVGDACYFYIGYALQGYGIGAYGS